ncbi:MAG TPA: HTTM domain-containing protein, partial [Candidatus Kapabacteria bacterium]|nr:HTTM domain-containing protein [Candidatus Kapabacteria bacterium]
PRFFFTYYGFEWVRPLPELGMYAVFAAMVLCSIFVIVGYNYRIAITSFFLLFTYVELIDKTNYLNHYYLVSLVTFLMIWLPLNSSYAIDAAREPWIRRVEVPRWMLAALLAQIGFVYFFGGIAKIKSDWLFEAQPLRIWLAANSGIPVIGPLLNEKWVAFAFSWFAMIFDLTIAFVLCSKRARPYGYAVLLTFHFLTAQFFRIGMFPYIMSISTLAFFSSEFHKSVLEKLSAFVKLFIIGPMSPIGPIGPIRNARPALLGYCIIAFFVLQAALPFRYIFYPGKSLWTEEAYRWSWNIMLIEKAGHAEFTVLDKQTGERWLEIPREHLTMQQEKQMAMQPDMILQFAHHLEDLARSNGHDDVAVFADTYVTLNGKPGRTLIDPSVDLTEQRDGFLPKSWILPFDNAPQLQLTEHIAQ